MLSELRFRRTIAFCAAIVTFGAGLFAGTGGSEADAVDTNPPAALHLASLRLPTIDLPVLNLPPMQLASLSTDIPPLDLQLFAPRPLTPAPPVTASLPPLDSTEQAAEPFGIETSKLTSGGMVRKWRNVSGGILAEQRLLEMCRQNSENCVPAAKRFLAVIEVGRSAQGRARIGLINRAVNLSIRPVNDKIQYGVEDLWATPLMTFASGAGDCEDYAVAKYVALREAGIAESDLRLVVVRDNAVNDFHAVAAVRDNGRWLVLDNRTLAIRDDIDIADFKPLFAMNDTGVRRIQALPPRGAAAVASAGGSGLPRPL